METESAAGRPDVVIVQQARDVHQVMRTWAVSAPDWTPSYKTRTIVPTRVSAVWVDGKINRVAVSGPYRMKSGAVAVAKGVRDESHIGGTGSVNFRPDQDRMEFVHTNPDGSWVEYSRDNFPGWVEEFVTRNAPTFTAQEG